MVTLTSFTRNGSILLSAAAVVLGLLAATPALADTANVDQCHSHNSDSSIVCTGGTKWCGSTCQASPTPTGTQDVNCTSCATICAPATPCGYPTCTAPTSSPAGTVSCSGNGSCPANGGVYTDQCSSAFGCPTGKTRCTSPNSCATTLSCPSGFTFDPCANGGLGACVSPYVVLSPGAQQSGFINISGNLTTGGDLFMSNGKAIRVDGSGVTDLNIGNWGGGATGLNVNAYGRLKVDGTAGELNINRASTSFVNRIVFSTANVNDWQIGQGILGPGFAIKRISSPPDVGPATFYIDQSDNVGIGTQTPGYKLHVAGTFVVGAAGSGFGGATPSSSWAISAVSPAAGGGGVYSQANLANANAVYGRANVSTANGIYGEATVGGTNGVYGSAGNVTAIGGYFRNTAGGEALRVDNQAVFSGGLRLTTGAAAGRFLQSDATGNASWVAPPAGVGGAGAVGQAAFWTSATDVGGDNGFFWDNTNKRLRLGGAGFGAATLDVRSSATYPAYISATNSASGIIAVTQTAGTNDLHSGLQLERDTTAVAAAGLGTGVGFSLEDASGTIYGGTGGMYNFWTDAAAATRVSALSFHTKDNAVGAAEKMRITGSGSVGIGTTTPGIVAGATKYVSFIGGRNNLLSLEIEGGSDSASGIQSKIDFIARTTANSDANTGRIEMQNSSTNTGHGIMKFYTNGGGGITERMRIMETGNVGIGTTTPARTLDVAGTVAMTGATTGYGDVLHVSQTGSGYAVYGETAAPGNALAAAKFVNTSTGRGLEVVGGTTQPAAVLIGTGSNMALSAQMHDHATTNTLETVAQFRRGSSATPAVGMGGSIDFSLEGTDGFYGGSKIGSVISTMNPTFRSDLVFWPSPYSASEKMRLTAAGDLGIGTASPTLGSKLQVDHDGASTYGVAMRMNQNAVGNADGPKMEFYKTMTSPVSWTVGMANGANVGDFTINSGAGATAGFGTQRLAINTAGAVGIGLAPTSYKLTVAGDVYANGGWLRTSGSAGWYNESYGGGWYMVDSTWIRSYNGKPTYMEAGFDTASVGGVGCGGGMGGGYNFRVCGTANITGTLTMNANTTLYSPGRLHVDGEDYLYILNQAGVMIGREWGGNGNLRAQGIITVDDRLGVGGDGAGCGYKICAWGGGIWSAGRIYGNSDMVINGPITANGDINTNANWFTAWGAGMQPYIGADGCCDVQIGSWNGGVTEVHMWSPGYGWMNLRARNFWTSSSIRWKKDVETITDGLERVRAMRGVTFHWNENYDSNDKDALEVGFIAEEMLKVVPEVVGRDKDDQIATLDYAKLTAVLAQAIKELDAQTIKLGPDGKVMLDGDLVAGKNLWGDGSGWLACPEKGQCTCPQGSYMTKIEDRGAKVYCNKL